MEMHIQIFQIINMQYILSKNEKDSIRWQL